MRSWERAVEKPPVRRGYDHHPSFSSSLLDSIYRSIDDDETRPDKKTARGEPHHHHQKQQTSSRWAPQVAERPPAVTRSKKQPAAPAVTRPRQFQTSTSSSSDCSSYGGFSSSETESVASRPKPNRLRPIRTEKTRSDSLPPPRPPSPEKKKIKNLGSIRSKLRDLKKSRSPTSPAARLAGFLNNLFNSKHKSSSGGGGAASSAGGSGFSGQDSASSFSRSCLVKTPSLAGNGGERTVRFQLPLDASYGRTTAPAPPARMTWRVYEEEADDVASDSSSDLFELENLSAIGRYRDELPVYETTHLGGRARLVNF